MGKVAATSSLKPVPTGLMQFLRKTPLLCQRLVLPDLFSIAKLRDKLRIVIENGGLEIIRFARQMPEMEPNRGAIAPWFPGELFIVQVIREVEDNFVDILETVEYIVRG